MAAAAAASATASISASDTQSVALEAHNALRAEYDVRGPPCPPSSSRALGADSPLSSLRRHRRSSGTRRSRRPPRRGPTAASTSTRAGRSSRRSTARTSPPASATARATSSRCVPLSSRRAARAVCFTADARRIPARPRLAALVGRVVRPERRQPGLQPLYGDGLEGHDQRRLPRRDRARPPRSSALARPIPALAPDDHPPSTGPALSATTSTPSAPARASRTTSSATTRPSETSSESVSARLSLLRFPSTAGADRCFSPRVATCSSVQRRRVRLHLFPVRSLPGQPTDAASLLSLCLCRVTCDSC